MSFNDSFPSRTRNTYYVMRHGRSEANEAHLIVSNPLQGVTKWGLADGAQSLVEQQLSDWSDLSVDRIISSPFRRARETAEIAASHLGQVSVILDDRLRERFFGELDGSADSAYRKVWVHDARDSANKAYGAESPDSVLARLIDLINSCERDFISSKILLVSHGDPLDILLARGIGLSLREHMSIAMKTAEIRSLFPRDLPPGDA